MNTPTSIAVGWINFYQKELSHKKKFHCAHGVLHQGLSCSEYCKDRIEKLGVLPGLKATLFRFKDCYLAGKRLKIMKASMTTDVEDKQNEKKTEKKHNSDSFCAKWIAVESGACCLLSLLPL